MNQQLRIGIVAGEASGDILGSGLMKAIKALHPQASFEGIGGPLMCAEGFHSHFDMERLSVMGLIEPLKRLPELLSIRRSIINFFTANPPDVFLGIDSPDFNLTIERKLRERGIKTAHYVSPSVWAWRQKRIHNIARSVDLMLTLFPFETEIYQQHQIPVKFVGHPLADHFPLEPDVVTARNTLKLTMTDRVIALLPGSRGGEVKLLGELFLQVAKSCHDIDHRLKFVLPAANSQRGKQLQKMLKQFPRLPVRLLDGSSHTTMAAADVVLMASGTTTLEALLLKKPMVVTYKMAPLSYAIISRMVKSKFISLPNLLADKALVPEILQNAATVENIVPRVMELLDSVRMRTELSLAFQEIHHALKKNASATAALALIELIQKKN